jgi:hypothetical protein
MKNDENEILERILALTEEYNNAIKEQVILMSKIKKTGEDMNIQDLVSKRKETAIALDLHHCLIGVYNLAKSRSSFGDRELSNGEFMEFENSEEEYSFDKKPAFEFRGAKYLIEKIENGTALPDGDYYTSTVLKMAIDGRHCLSISIESESKYYTEYIPTRNPIDSYIPGSWESGFKDLALLAKISDVESKKRAQEWLNENQNSELKKKFGIE